MPSRRWLRPPTANRLLPTRAAPRLTLV